MKISRLLGRVVYNYPRGKMNISILGSTGSIGTQTLDVIDEFSDLKVVGLAAGGNLSLLSKQIKKYRPKVVSVRDSISGKSRIQNDTIGRFSRGVGLRSGDEGNCAVATLPAVDKVVIATPGLAGIKPTLAAIKAKKTVALATKEVLVAAGNLVTREAKKNGVKILPIDSEHSAIFQCLEGRSPQEIKRIILTASGGPFRGKSLKQLKNITPDQALSHPTWKMGRKITTDSATLMNKGFEIIEAMWLFGVPLSKIKVVVHPQSVVHSAVEFVDGSIIAQVGPSDMRLPIQFALLYPGKRRENNFKRFSFTDFSDLTFEEPDIKTFRCLDLALKAISKGGTASAVLTAANDVAVEAFLVGKLSFLAIPQVIESTLASHTAKKYQTLDVLLAVDAWAREKAAEFVVKFGHKA